MVEQVVLNARSVVKMEVELDKEGSEEGEERERGRKCLRRG